MYFQCSFLVLIRFMAYKMSFPVNFWLLPVKFPSKNFYSTKRSVFGFQGESLKKLLSYCAYFYRYEHFGKILAVYCKLVSQLVLQGRKCCKPSTSSSICPIRLRPTSFEPQFNFKQMLLHLNIFSLLFQNLRHKNLQSSILKLRKIKSSCL